MSVYVAPSLLLPVAVHRHRASTTIKNISLVLNKSYRQRRGSVSNMEIIAHRLYYLSGKRKSTMVKCQQRPVRQWVQRMAQYITKKGGICPSTEPESCTDGTAAINPGLFLLAIAWCLKDVSPVKTSDCQKEDRNATTVRDVPRALVRLATRI